MSRFTTFTLAALGLLLSVAAAGAHDKHHQDQDRQPPKYKPLKSQGIRTEDIVTPKNGGPVVRDHRTPVIVRDHRTPVVVRDHRDPLKNPTGPIIRDHRDPVVINKPQGPIIRDHRTPVVVRDHRDPVKNPTGPIIRDHRTPVVVRDHRDPVKNQTGPIIRDHRDPVVINKPQGPIVRDHRTPVVVRDHRAPDKVTWPSRPVVVVRDPNPKPPIVNRPRKPVDASQASGGVIVK